MACCFALKNISGFPWLLTAQRNRSPSSDLQSSREELLFNLFKWLSTESCHLLQQQNMSCIGGGSPIAVQIRCAMKSGFAWEVYLCTLHVNGIELEEDKVFLPRQWSLSEQCGPVHHVWNWIILYAWTVATSVACPSAVICAGIVCVMIKQHQSGKVSRYQALVVQVS